MEALLELELPDVEAEEDGAFEVLVVVNHRWLGRYARLHPSFSVEPALLERNSLWMNAFFQKARMTTSAASPQAQSLVKKHRETVVERLRSAPLPLSESPFSTCVVDPMAALMFAASSDRCPHSNLEDLLAEAWELLQCASIRAHALQSGFARCIFRFLTEFTEPQKRIPCLRLLVLLAEENSSAVVNASKVAAQGQFWQPNMFVFSLQKRHQDNSTLCELAVRLLEFFSHEMPIPPPVVLDQSCDEDKEVFARLAGVTSPHRAPTAHLSPLRRPGSSTALPLLIGGHRSPGPLRTLFSPTTTISKLYQEAPSPYCPTMTLPLTRPPTSPVEQSRRAQIFSMPKLAAVEGQRQHRCNSPNAPPSRVERSIDVEACRTLDPLLGSPPQSPSGPNKPRAVVSEKYSWNPECINSVSGFEWWWRSLPQNDSSLEPTQKLKMVTKAAVRLHSKGELQRAIELYRLALSSETNAEVAFRLRINLACAFEAAEELPSSIEEFRIALELNPSDPYAIFKLGSVLTSAGEFEEARLRFESILGEYAQAADGLKTLEVAVEAYKQEEEARRAVIASAKARRSPPKVIHPRSYLTTPREPIAPSTLLVQPPAPRRKKTPAPKREHPPLNADTSEKTEPAVTDTPAKATPSQTATVATLTDDHLVSPGLLELLVRRCQETRTNVSEVLEQLDPHQRGLVHRESFMNLLRVVAGIITLDIDNGTALGVSPDDWVNQGNQTFLKYGGFLNAYTEQHQVEAALLSSGEVVRVKLWIDDLIRHDKANFSHRSVSEWLRLGSERAAAELRRISSEASELSCVADDSSGKEGSWSTPDLQASKQDLFTPRTRARKDRTREEWVLTAEKARVLGRRQQHCMKSLRDIAARARAHIVSRRNAMAFLFVAAQNAQEELRMRKVRCMTARQEEAAETRTSHDGEATSSEERTEIVPNDKSGGTQLHIVKGLSEETYASSVRAAMTRLRQNAELEGLKTVSTRFAAFCQVPPFFLDARVRASDEVWTP
ncbi:hypothetical protein PHYPSEUDO_001436 [Phytophthora pseudosyringae]|uniref:Uncharacterized protein n=1 Tax=Phytophthora pseudosyringae TaxID=221518 RepID=A0A8T1VX27_9STRA|nr:hypothetical protein PHYPSEUDO_001436 [Phytophthora pseudosyringae]